VACGGGATTTRKPTTTAAGHSCALHNRPSGRARARRDRRRRYRAGSPTGIWAPGCAGRRGRCCARDARPLPDAAEVAPSRVRVPSRAADPGSGPPAGDCSQRRGHRQVGRARRGEAARSATDGAAGGHPPRVPVGSAEVGRQVAAPNSEPSHAALVTDGFGSLAAVSLGRPFPARCAFRAASQARALAAGSPAGRRRRARRRRTRLPAVAPATRVRRFRPRAYRIGRREIVRHPRRRQGSPRYADGAGPGAARASALGRPVLAAGFRRPRAARWGARLR